MGMATFAGGEDLSGAVFADVDLRGAKFVESDLSRVVIRGCAVGGMEVDAPWLRFGAPMIVNGVDIGPFVEAELNRRFPGREEQTAESPQALAAAWDKLEAAWTAALTATRSCGKFAALRAKNFSYCATKGPLCRSI